MSEQQDGSSREPAEGLTGLRVLDIGMNLAGPFCATLLGEFGAEVIKVERPGVGDMFRTTGGDEMSYGGLGFFWALESRNKKSVTCNLRHPRGRDLALRLVAKSDIVVESFQPGTLERWGLGYEDLCAVKPDIIMVRVSGYGQTGPYRAKPGFARIGQAFSGLTWLCGTSEMPALTPGSTSIADYNSGLFSAVGALVALEHRRRTGEGQVVDMALYEATFRIMDTLTLHYAVKGVVRGPVGRGTPLLAPHGQFPCQDGRWIAIACNSDRMWQDLTRAAGRPELGHDPRYATISARVRHREEVDRIVTEFTMSHPMREVWRLLDEVEVPVGPCYSIDGIYEASHYWERGSLVKVDDPVLGEVGVPGVVPHLSKTPGRIKHLGPLEIGWWNEAIYCGMLGLSREELAALREEGAV